MNLTEGKCWSILVENHHTFRYLPNVLEWQIPDLFPEKDKRPFFCSVRCFLLFVGCSDERRVCDSTFNWIKHLFKRGWGCGELLS